MRTAKQAKSPQEEPGQAKPWTLRESWGKTNWDWMELLIVPVAILLITVGFTWQQNNRQEAFEEQRAQDLAVQGYLDQMGTLILEGLSDPKVQTIAHARTLSVLKRVDSSRRDEVMQFLIGADLLNKVSLNDAELQYARLIRANLSYADLSDADLHGAHLSDANLTEAKLGLANLSNAYLNRVSLYQAEVYGANLFGASLKEADLEEAYLGGATLKEADMSNAYLHEADLRGARLSGADLSKADLSRAYLAEADLSDVNLRGADLSYANLQEATGITEEQIEEQATSLKCATMPNEELTLACHPQNHQ